MQSMQEDMSEFRRQLRNGSIQKAYRALLAYMMDLRADFTKRYPNHGTSGLYHGYMDMTYFAVFPESLRDRNLKIAIVFNFEAFRFEAWLAAGDKRIQQKYWELFRDSHWNEYRVVTPGKGVDSIVECILAENFDFGDLDKLTADIAESTGKFIDDIGGFLSDRQAM
jgi:hypothetical protein